MPNHFQQKYTCTKNMQARKEQKVLMFLNRVKEYDRANWPYHLGGVASRMLN
jgi:hypothetical protein